MKFVDEYRRSADVRRLSRKLQALVSKNWTLMEICGGQTHAIVRFGIDEILPPGLELLHGPGCPVCVTPLETVDKALLLAARKNVIFCSFGDMLRVPGSQDDLLQVKARGGDVRTVYSPLDALEIALKNPQKEVIFFAVGFETTAPATAATVLQAEKLHLENFSLLTAHVLVPPAVEALLSSPDSRIDGLLLAGHVCTVTGFKDYEPLAEKFQVPMVVTGFEPLDLIQGITQCVLLLEQGKFEVVNRYTRAVQYEGNPEAKKMVGKVFEPCDRKWRGLGKIEKSGLKLRESYARFDAESKFALEDFSRQESPLCRSGEILRGILKPSQCPAFARECTPEHPLGATMVSSEGACAAYYKYKPKTE